MNKLYSWADIITFFNNVNKSGVHYVVLRNFEEMHTTNFFSSGHEDIDILCDNLKEFTLAAQAYPELAKSDGIHFTILLENKEIPIDLRTDCDNYYDPRWACNILSRRVKAANGNWYVPDYENYYYSLVYHAIIQKKEFGLDYLKRLNIMANDLGIAEHTKREHIYFLKKYMKKNNYYYTFPDDVSVPLNIRYTSLWRMRGLFKRIKYNLLRIVNKVKISIRSHGINLLRIIGIYEFTRNKWKKLRGKP